MQNEPVQPKNDTTTHTGSRLPAGESPRRRIHTIALLTALLAFWGSSGLSWAEHPSVDTRPNIVLVMADDMGIGDTSAYQDITGNSDGEQIHTPNMERLARMGIRFTDAHTPSTRCTCTRYGLLTGRYPWRSRMKHFVLFGSQGDPMIEADRPTLAVLTREAGYRTGMVGKWHVGLRYRRSDGSPAAGWDDADLTQPLFDTPLDHGFDFCRITSRSHGTSGPQPQSDKNRPDQTVGPGHIEGRTAVGATGRGKQLASSGPDAYVLKELGGQHSDHAVGFLEGKFGGEQTDKPFFLYYACNSNHTPYTPDSHIGDQPVAGAGRTTDGEPVKRRGDFIHENDVALGRLLDYLERTDDPRRPGEKLIDNTIVVFTSDNGAERNNDTATGPLRSNKGSAYEGGHRVPLIVAWPHGNVGDGDPSSAGQTNDSLVGLQDLYATYAEAMQIDLPDLMAGEKGAEDSLSMLAAWRGEPLPERPLFVNDHKQAEDRAAVAMRLDDPVVDGETVNGQWKIFFDGALLRSGQASPFELYDLATDPRESTDRLSDPELDRLVEHLCRVAVRHRAAGGHRLVAAAGQQVSFDCRENQPPHENAAPARVVAGAALDGEPVDGVTVSASSAAAGVSMTLAAETGDAEAADATFAVNPRGVGVSGGELDQVENGEALLVRFDRDVIVESVALVAGNGTCGGFYRVGDSAPLAIYCVDGDNDLRDQSGVLSDIGILKKGETLRLSSSPHHGVETPGQWRLGSVTVRLLP